MFVFHDNHYLLFIFSSLLYLPAKVDPVVSSSLGVSSVSVTAISLEGWRGVAHSPQNFWVSGLAVLHVGHLMDTAVPLAWSKKEYQGRK